MYEVLSRLLANFAKQNVDRQWQNRKAELCDGLSPKYSRMLDLLLENGRRDYYTIQNLHSHSGNTLLQRLLCPACHERSKTSHNLNDLLAQITASVFPKLLAHHIVGVQPCVAPVSMISVLRYVWPQGQTEEKQPCKLELNLEVVTAKTRKLSARWAVDAGVNKDHLAKYGLIPETFERELIEAICQEIGVEIDQDLLRTLRGLPPPPTEGNIFDQKIAAGAATTIVDEFAVLAVLIGRQANLIATRTRRAKGNWAVVSPTALTILEAARASTFTRINEGNYFFDDVGGRPKPGRAKHCGTLNDSINIFCDSYADETVPVLIGFKGDSEVDAAAYYSPYVLVSSHGVVADPTTFELCASFYTRYGWTEMQATEDSPTNTTDYLGLVGIKAENLTFI